MMHYTGIGSRSTPPKFLRLMTRIAGILEQRDYILRSGGAPGADTAFEQGVVDEAHLEIFLPWPKFNGSLRASPNTDHARVEATRIAESFHPAWERCSPAARKLHIRNVHQVLGADLKTPSEFVVCWTSDGKASGGTGQALRIAKSYKVPVYNLYNQPELDALRQRFGTAG